MSAWLRFVAVALVAVATPIAASAQVPSSDQPGRERERFTEGPVLKARPAGPTISISTAEAPAGASSVTLTVASVRFEGATAYDAATLEALAHDVVGHRVSLAAIYELARRITAKYGNDGYVLSRATIPPQELDPKGATVTIRVVEGYVDAVVWPDTLKRGSDFTASYSAKITSERPANIKTIMRYVLLADDLPGVSVTSRFQASTTNPGASTLIVEATRKSIDATVRLDNRGTEARGPFEYQASVTENDGLGLHEAITGTVAGVTDSKELHYLALAARRVLSAEGLTAFADASYSWGRPGTATLEALDFASNSFATDFGLSFPILRQRERNLTLSALAFVSNDEGEMLSTPSSADRLRGFRLKAEFDAADNSRGTTQGSVVFSQGIKGLGSTENGNSLASRENGRVDFTKIAGSISRTQPLMRGLSLKAALEGQYAFTPLLTPEECGYGGTDFGRAFDPSEITGDSCWSASGELRFDMPGGHKPFFDTQQLYAFVDYGSVYRLAPSAGTPTSQSGSSAGLGLRLGKDRFNADLSAVKPLSGRTDDGWRFFFSASARY